MIRVNIPGDRTIEIKNVVFDYNGTIAEDGILIEGLEEKFKELAARDVNIFVVTADTYGNVKKQCIGLTLKIEVFDKENASQDKKRIIEGLGGDTTVSIGNGRIDSEMFKSSAISIAVIGKEGCYTKTLLQARIVVKDIKDAIDLLLKDSRIKATMRT